MAARLSGRNHAVKPKSLQNCKYKNAIETHTISVIREKDASVLTYSKWVFSQEKEKDFI